MALAPWVLFVLMAAAVAGPPLWFATLRSSLRAPLLIGHAGLLQVVPGVLSPYGMPLADGLEVRPGNVLFMGILLTLVLLVLVEREAGAVRSMIIVLVAVSVAEIAWLAATDWAVGSSAFAATRAVDPELYREALTLAMVGNLLVIGELLVFFVVVQSLLERVRRAVHVSLATVLLFMVVAVLDGVLFAAAYGLIEQAGVGFVARAALGKAFLAMVFGAPLLAVVAGRGERLFPPAPPQRLRVRDVLLPPPRRAVIARLEEERANLQERTLLIAEEERQRLAEDLHDEAIQLLAAADIRTQRLASSHPDVDLENVQRLIREGVGTLRRHILELRSPDVTASSFEALVRAYVDRLLPEDGPDVNLSVDLPDDLDGPAVAGAYRIVLEAVSNTVKHARADLVTVDVHVDGGHIVGEVVDDGIGLPAAVETGPGHLGLRAMRDRADVLGGEVSVRPGTVGTEVRFSLPLDVPAQYALSGSQPHGPSAADRLRST